MNTQADEGNAAQAPLTRAGLLRRLFVFQIKLALDGLRDLVLSPVSFVAVAVGLIAGGERPEGPFRRVLAFGRRSDAWIDLFDTHGGPLQGDEARPASAESIIDRIEAIVREEFARGGGRRAIEARLESLRRSSAVQETATGEEAGTIPARAPGEDGARPSTDAHRPT
ncbi:MAG TPA: hypothetical protein VLA56_19640 [Pseudomonadales bacterium]|nr:hypothetical protein [Pseudomonadales bacterium]